jgi:hypothetical protein
MAAMIELRCLITNPTLPCVGFSRLSPTARFGFVVDCDCFVAAGLSLEAYLANPGQVLTLAGK